MTFTPRIILKIALPLLAVGALWVAWVADGAGSGYTFATGSGQGGIELKIDSVTVYNGEPQPALSWSLKNLVPGVDRFFNFDDVKPGDTGRTTVSVHVSKNPGWACLDFKNLTDAENGVNEPESALDTTPGQGELSGEIEFFSWRDDGDNVFEVGETPLFGTTTQMATTVLNRTYVIADSTTGAPIPKNSTRYIGMTWCAGDLSVDLATAAVSCNGQAMGNEAQTDSLSVDVQIRAVDATGHGGTFTCTPQPRVDKCEIEGYKYDADGKPLAGWPIGLMKLITHKHGVDAYDLATTTTDQTGYYCLRWDGEQRTPRGTPTYTHGSYSFEYFVYERTLPGWVLSHIKRGPNAWSMSVVPAGQIVYSANEVRTSMGSGYIISDAAYRIDFYNRLQSPSSQTNGNSAPVTRSNLNPPTSTTTGTSTVGRALPPGQSAASRPVVSSSFRTVTPNQSNLIAQLTQASRTALKKLGL
jgi:hypothetical protein